MRYTTILAFVLSAILMAGHSCKTNSNSRPAGEQTSVFDAEPAIDLIEISDTKGEIRMEFGETLILKSTLVSNDLKPDSIRVWFNGSEYGTYRTDMQQIEIRTGVAGSVGRKQFRISAYKSGYRPQVITGTVELVSDIMPENYSYRVVNRYPHDPSAYTQGLLFHNGYLYESTGQPGKSSVRRVELNTGKVIEITSLESRFFGEGLALIDDFLYQLTWTSRVGFVYEAATLKQVRKIYYQTEGWGLTNLGDNLIMSDGSGKLRVMSPEDFSMVSQFDVYDNNGPVTQLNELENINGEIWANIYTTDRLVIIEAATGRVKAYVNLAGILPKADFGPETDYLNGIAWDKEKNRLFVTGKNWPALFEIELVRN